MAKSDPQAEKFAADKMLGRLAKWLRVLGRDVAYGPHLTGYGLIRLARMEDRLILTRDRGLKRKNPPEFLLIESDCYREQLKQAAEHCRFDLKAGLFTRCLECNTLLQPLTKKSVEQKVPPYVFLTQDRFSSCPRCRRIYWPATHQQRMIEELSKIGLLT